jgi:hypothetical protein
MHLQYAEAFEDQALGYGLLHPASTERLHPGVCGYFDEDGDWKTIVDIPRIIDGQVKALGDLRFTTLDEVPTLPSPMSMRWEPKCSAAVSYTKVSQSASIGYIVNIMNRIYWRIRPSGKQSAFDSFKFTKGKEFGAVLVAEADVKQEYYSEDTPFYRWLKINFPAVVYSYPKLIESETPLWIITKVYHTRKCSISCWSGSQQDISLEFGIDAAAEGEAVTASPATSHVRVKTSGLGWAHYGINELIGSTTAVKSLAIMLIKITGPEASSTDFVLFVGGLQFTASRTILGQVKPSHILLTFVAHRHLYYLGWRIWVDGFSFSNWNACIN